MMDLYQVAQLVESYEREWTRRGQWKAADLTRAAAFLATEAGEVLSEALRIEGGFVRNIERAEQLEAELADAFMMLLITANRGGVDLQRALIAKLKAMDAKRGGGGQGRAG